MASTAGNLLLRAGKITAEQLAAARALAHEKSYPLTEALVRGGAIDEPGLVEFFARRLMIERLPPSRLHAIPKPVQRSVPPDMANEFRVVPIEFSSDGALVIAMADPTDTHAVDEVRFFTDRFDLRVARRFGPPGSDNEVSLTALSLKGRYADFHEDKFRHEPDLYLGVRIGW